MTSYFGFVELLAAVIRLGSRNMSTTTSADVSIVDKLLEPSLGAMDQSTARFKEVRFKS